MKILTRGKRLLFIVPALVACCAAQPAAAQASGAASQPGVNSETQRASVQALKIQGAATVAPPADQSTTIAGASPSSTSSSAPAAQITNAPTQPSPADPPPADDERLAFLDEGRVGESNESAPGALGLMARTLGALCLIVGLIFAASWGLRRFGGARFGQTGEHASQLSVLSSVSLGDKRSLAVVRFGGRVLLIGSTGQAITLLAEDEDEGEARDEAAPPARSVAELLSRDAAGAFEHEFVMAGERLEEARPAFRGNAGADESGGAI
jgi:flagellar biosynthetic protein FliO